MALGLGLFAVWPPLVLMSLIGLAIARGSRVDVTVDFQGLSWRRRWSRRRSQINLEVIASASTTVHETAWQAFRRYDRDGGDPEVTDIRLRPGPALSIRLHDGHTWTFSVDDAHEAADVLNALVARHRLAQGSESEVVQATSPSERSG
jgi:hypothetical protein